MGFVVVMAKAVEIPKPIVEVDRVELKVRGVYDGLCINCGGPIDDLRLMYGMTCSRCSRVKELRPLTSFEEIASTVKEVKPGSRLDEMLRIERFVKELEQLFEKCVGSKPWSIQRTWMYRIAQRQSFAMIAPTGVGKTTFGLVTALHLARKGMKTYIIVPTTVLVMQYAERLQQMMDRAGVIANVVAIHSRIPKKKRIELQNAVIRGDFDILITTSAYLQRKFDEVFKPFIERGGKIDFVFVDDVDAVMKGSKAIELILKLVGFGDDDIKKGYEAMELRRAIVGCEEVIRRGTELERRLNELRRMLENVKGSIRNRIKEEIERIERELKRVERCKEELDTYVSIRKELEEKRRRCGFIVLSSATGRARGRRVRLFRELLGFDVGSRTEVYRNIVDAFTYPDKGFEEKVLELVRMLGTGGLIFVPVDKGIEYAEALASYLREHGIKADTLVTGKIHNLERFVSGEIDVLVGVAIYYGLMTRGIDLPERVRYAIFVGVPRHKVCITKVELSPSTLLRLAALLVEVSPPDVKEKLSNIVTQLRRVVRRLSPQAIKMIVEKVSRGEIDTKSAEIVKHAYELISELLRRPDIVDAIKRYPRAAVVEENGLLYVLIPDAPTYIQASGRTSRLFAGGITRGLSIVIVDDERLLHGLEYRLRFYIEDFRFQRLEELNLEEIVKQIDEDREFVRAVKEGRIAPSTFGKELVRTALMIVESPNKARTIASFFGRPSVREIEGIRIYETDIGNLHLLIVASGGHVFDLVEEELGEVDILPLTFGDVEAPSIYGVYMVSDGDKIRFVPRYGYLKRCTVCGHQFVKVEKDKLVCPRCGSTAIRSAEQVVKVLQRIALEVDEVLIGTDPDAEGEKIGFDIALALAPYAKKIKRIEFHEITRKAILNALANPRPIKMSLVEAQIVRRIEDRWIGFALSEYVTQQLVDRLRIVKAKGRLSAGRVQTPALGRVIELYLQYLINRRRCLRVEHGDIRLDIPIDHLLNVLKYVAELYSDIPNEIREILRVGGKELLRRFGRCLKQGCELLLRIVPQTSEVVKIGPPPPFTTDALLSEASSLLRLSAAQVMQIAQELFELGLITYHRTDSTRISSAGIAVARQYIEQVFGDRARELFVPRTWGEGGAHEGIRPTKPIDAEQLKNLIAEGVIEIAARLTPRHYAVYDLIFRRFIASQMKPATIERVICSVQLVLRFNGREVVLYEDTKSFITSILDPGFTLVYQPFKLIPIDIETPIELKIDRKNMRLVVVSDVLPTTQGELVKWMKEVGIGRPSTYAKIVQVILDRGYVREETRKRDIRGRLRPSARGLVVYTTLAGFRYPQLSEAEKGRELILDDRVRRSLARTKLHGVPVIEILEKLASEVREGIAHMVSVEKTRELVEAMDAIESGERVFEDEVLKLFDEMCRNVFPLLIQGMNEEDCRID